ncbi:MAG: DNA alkylation repair protein [Firmicutes bacterium HGW-Firmicutes-1]|jgi:3-methyladenine DNA glycosylase AlkD|nr:MAG: DNA alkylation repair protein [Firmicutes bacterium HGW-Firmicutes-1]
MDLFEIMSEIELLGNARMKKYYESQGAREPLFGVTTGALKPIAKRIKKNQQLAEELYATGNYDAMYLAGMLADPKKMTPADFDCWIEKAYFHMISDFIVAVTLAETDFAQEVADKFIASRDELIMSAGWSCYEWLIGSRKDTEFNPSKILSMLDVVEKNIHDQPNRTRYAMNGFVTAVGISYIPLHEEAMRTAERIGEVSVSSGKNACSVLNAFEKIKSETDKGRLGFKRKNVRC